MAFPLKEIEVKNIVSGIEGKDYFYKCQEAPCSMNCNKKQCRKCVFGLAGKRQQDIDTDLFSNFIKVIVDNEGSDNCLWYFTYKNKRISAMTNELLDIKIMKMKILSHANEVVFLNRKILDAIINDQMEMVSENHISGVYGKTSEFTDIFKDFLNRKMSPSIDALGKGQIYLNNEEKWLGFKMKYG